MVENAKVSVNDKNVVEDLIVIESQYKFLLDYMDKFENGELTIKNAYEVLKNLDFKDDVCKIKNYILKRLNKNDIIKIMNRLNENVNPVEYAQLENCQPTTIAVERSFSNLSKILAKDRNFKDENVRHYMISKYNIGKV